MECIKMKDMISEVEKEIGMRNHVYPRQVSAGKMSQETAERKIEIMRAIRENLKQQLPPENEQPDMLGESQ